MIYRPAWRNIWRNKLRSGIIMGAIAIGMFAGTLLVAFLKGWSTDIIQEHIDMQVSCIQIHRNDDRAENDASNFFAEEEVVQVLETTPGITGFSTRLKADAVLTSPEESTGVTLIGVDPEMEKKISRVYTTIPDSAGSFLSHSEVSPIVISRETADRLKVRLRSKIVLNVQDCSGEIQSTLFRVGGIFATHSKRFDAVTAYVRKSDLAPYLMTPEGCVHEIAVMTAEPKKSDEQARRLSQRLPSMLKAESWGEVFPVLNVGLFWLKVFSYLFLGVFLTALSFGTVNIMQMAVMERDKEFKMLYRIGMAPRLILKMVLLETCFLTLVGAIVGIVPATVLAALTADVGLNISMLFNLKFAYGFGEVVHPELSVVAIVEIFILVAVSATVSAILPMHHTLKIMK